MIGRSLLAIAEVCGVSFVMFHVKHGGVVEPWGWQFEKCRFPHVLSRGGSVSRETWKFIQLFGKRVIQLFVVAGAYGFALFENWETQTRWRAFADLAFVRVVLSCSSV